MRDIWPDFSVRWRERSGAVWRGRLKPLFQTFEIEIAYRAPLVIELLNKRRLQPQVSVISPLLRPRPGDPEGQLPHVYYVGENALDVILCMFDPDSEEWSPTESIAHTTVPFTIDWITSYEGWRATGEWTSTGKHLENSQLA